MAKTMNFFVLTILISLFASCATNPVKEVEKNLIGKWKITKLETNEKMSSSRKNVYDEVVKSMISNAQITFNTSKSYEMIFDGTSKGTWVVAPDGKSIITTQNSKDDKMYINSISDKDLVLILDFDSERFIMTLTKNN